MSELLTPFQLFAMDHARCYGKHVPDMDYEAIIERWEDASEEVKIAYEKDCQKLYDLYGPWGRFIGVLRLTSLKHVWPECHCWV